MAERTVTRTETVGISPRETRLRSLLASIASANDRGERPSKAALCAGLSSRTRADHYRQIDVLVRRHLASPGLNGTSYHLEITEAGREVLEHGTAEATYEATEYGSVRWAITEHIIDGAALTWSFDTRDEALEFAGKNRQISDEDGSVASVMLTEMWQPSGRSISSAEAVTSEAIWTREPSS